MASGRIRSLKPELLEDEKVAGLSDLAFRVLIGLFLIADDYGNARANSRYLQGQIAWSTAHTPEEITEGVKEIEAAGMVWSYEAREQVYLHIKNWDKHQRVDKPGKPRVPRHDDAESSRKIASQDIPELPRKNSWDFGKASADPDLDPDPDPNLDPDPDPPCGEPNATASAVASSKLPAEVGAEPAKEDPPEPKKPKAKKPQPEDLDLSLLSDPERKAYEAILGDESILPIVKLPARLSRDLVALGPGCDVAWQIKAAGAWLRANPKNAKSLGNRFLTSWVSRKQERGGFVSGQARLSLVQDDAGWSPPVPITAAEFETRTNGDDNGF